MSRSETDKGRLIKSLNAQRVMFEVILEQIPAAQMLVPGVDEPNGTWTVKDIIAHVTTWDRRGTVWIAAAGRGEMPEPGKMWRDLDALNKQTYLENRERPLNDILTEFEAAFPPLLEAAEAFPEDKLARLLTFDNGTKMQTMPGGRLIVWRYHHYRTHGEQIRTWFQQFTSSHSLY